VAGAKRILTASVLAMVAAAGWSHPAGAQASSVTLQLRNDAGLPGNIVAEAEAAVAGIYAKSGVDLSWSSIRADRTVIILPRLPAGLPAETMEQEKTEKMDHVPARMGFALGTETERGHVAYVLAHRVSEAASRYRVPMAAALGAVIAHEVGHLLLPFNAHSKTGIMRAVWTRADFLKASHGHLLFTEEQSARIRSGLNPEEQQVAAGGAPGDRDGAVR
jgi:hypothetical protein